MKSFLTLLMLLCSLGAGSTDKNEYAEAIKRNEFNVSLVGVVQTASTDYADISGGAYVIRIRGDKAKGSVPKPVELFPGSRSTRVFWEGVICEFDCKKIKETKKYVIYSLTDIYGNLSYNVRITCHVNGYAQVMISSNMASHSPIKFDAELEITGQDRE